MITRHRRSIALTALTLLGLGRVASAQSLATFGSAEAGGFGEGSALIGTSISTGRQGWGPVANIVAQTYRYRSSASTHDQAYAISPSAGLQYTMSEGSVNAMGGYSYVNTEFGGIVSGAEIGGKSGAFVSAQANYWGNGESAAQLIGSYGFASEYYWTRARASHQLSASLRQVFVGAELVVQGTQRTVVAAGITTPSQLRYQVGPTVEYRVSPELRLGASAGVRAGNNNTASSGYVRVEFLVLTPLGGM